MDSSQSSHFTDAFERALPDLDPELGDAYFEGLMGGVWKVLAARKGRVPSMYTQYVAMYAFGQDA